MSISRLLQWQWDGYHPTHQNKTNLLLHIIAVPLFIVATASALYALVRLSLFGLVVSLTGFTLSLIMQARGHKLEPVQPEPFKNNIDFACRILAEQWITFPRFVLTGGWFKTISQTRRTNPGEWSSKVDHQLESH